MRRALAPLALPSAVIAAALAWPAAAHAGCRVSVDPRSPERWQKAAEEAEKRLSEAQDCKQVEVRVRPDGSALLRFSTRDGRSTERELATPDELGPQIEALAVATNPVDEPPEPTPPTPPTPPGPPASEAPRERAGPGAVPEVVGVVGGGGRLSAKYAAPALELALRGQLRGWEAGLTGEWAPWFGFLAKNRPAGFAMSSLALGVQAGRREAAGRGALRYGASLAVMQVQAEASEADGPVSEDRAQVRAGLFAGAVFPAGSAVRGLVEVRGDTVLTQPSKIPSKHPSLSPPGLGGVLLLGVEGRLL